MRMKGYFEALLHEHSKRNELYCANCLAYMGESDVHCGEAHVVRFNDLDSVAKSKIIDRELKEYSEWSETQ